MRAVSLQIAHVTPHPVGSGTEVDRFARAVTEELARRGHRVLLVAPSADGAEVREARHALKAARDRPEELFSADGDPRVLARRRGPAAARPSGARGRCRSTSRGPSRRCTNRHARRLPRPRAVRAVACERRAAPLARAQRRHLPPAGRAGRRHPGRAQGRPARLRAPRRARSPASTRDAPTCWTASSAASTASSPPGADAPRSGSRRRRPVRIVFVERRGAARAAPVPARAARGSTRRCRWSATVVSARGPSASTPLRADAARAGHVRRGAARTRRSRAPTSSSPASDGAAPAPGARAARARRRRGAVAARLARLRGGARRGRARPALRSRATPTRSPRSSRG